jgi:DnaD/phage-associated family protein
MSIIRVRKDANYFSASNEPFNDTRLSWESRGLMGYLLSKPNNWEVRMSDLEKQGPAGNHKLRRMLAELRAYGYMNRIRVTVENNKFDWITEVFESPSQNPNPSKEIVIASGGFPTSGSSTSGKVPDIESTEETSTKERERLDAEVCKKLSELSGGSLNSDTPQMLDEWRINHSQERILQAIGIAKEKRARSAKYVDEILIGWEANGYPKTREQQVSERRVTKPSPSTPPAADNYEIELEARRARLRAQKANAVKVSV